MREALAERYLNGAVNRREKTEYGYSTTGYRVSAASYVDETGHGTFALANRVEFLADEHSLTSYAQTLRETHFDGAGQLSKTIDYSYGSDELTQTTRTYDAAGNVTSQETLLFGHDAHGSVRLLTTLAGAIEQLFLYDAYGEAVAFFNIEANALSHASLESAKTSYLHDGEFRDSHINAKYLRARWQQEGRFTSLDPYSGDVNSPLTFHKYGFVHGDPTNSIDPTGWSSANEQMSVRVIAGQLAAKLTSRLALTSLRLQAAVQSAAAAYPVVARLIMLGFPALQVFNMVMDPQDFQQDIAMMGPASAMDDLWDTLRNASRLMDEVFDVGRSFVFVGRTVDDKAPGIIARLNKASVDSSLGEHAAQSIIPPGWDELAEDFPEIANDANLRARGHLWPRWFQGKATKGWEDNIVALTRAANFKMKEFEELVRARLASGAASAINYRVTPVYTNKKYPTSIHMEALVENSFGQVTVLFETIIKNEM